VNKTLQVVLAYCGLVFAALFITGQLGIVHWVPPLAPSDSAAKTAAIYRNHTTQIRTGFLVLFVGLMAFPMFGGAIAAQTMRIREAPKGASYAQIAAVGCAFMCMMWPVMMFFVAAYRPDERSAEMTQLINDMAWLSYIVSFVPFVAWCFLVAVAILADTSAQPLFPRWVGYVSILAGLLQMPAGFLIYFTTGPFAWNGLFTFWLPAFDFFGWVVLMSVLTARAAKTVLPEDAPAQRRMPADLSR
jgi:hypothetical protein